MLHAHLYILNILSFYHLHFLFQKWSDLIEYVINKFVNSPQTECCHRNILSTDNVPT